MYNDHFDGVAQVEEIDLASGLKMGPFQRVVDLFGDQSVLAIAAPGHTHGNLSYLINTTEGWVLLTGDASHTRWGFENNVPPGWSEDSDHARATLQQLRQFSAANPEVRVIPGHEV
jgi:glyoxylase-like metal-dependent hydrolase (beta-lactamase superfamily II)